MKIGLIIAAIFGGWLLINGVTPIKRTVNEFANMGVLEGVERCLEYSSSELVSPETVRDLCTQKFRKPIYDGDAATGRAGPREIGGTVYLVGTINNKLPNFITTWVQFEFSIYDDIGSERAIRTASVFWIEPLSSSDFQVELPDIKSADFAGFEFCPHDESEKKRCIAWGTPRIEGIKLE